MVRGKVELQENAVVVMGRARRGTREAVEKRILGVLVCEFVSWGLRRRSSNFWRRWWWDGEALYGGRKL
jgi:hypothetical protein